MSVSARFFPAWFVRVVILSHHFGDPVKTKEPTSRKGKQRHADKTHKRRTESSRAREVTNAVDTVAPQEAVNILREHVCVVEEEEKQSDTRMHRILQKWYRLKS